MTGPKDVWDKVLKNFPNASGVFQKNSCNCTRLKKIIGKICFFIPSFSRFGLITKISLTILVAGICCDVFYAKLNPALPLLKGALSFSPVKYAQGLADEGKLKTAEEYIEFYTSIPGVGKNQELAELQKGIYEERHGIISGALHQGRHALKGIKGEESDEVVGQAADIAVDFTGAGDIRDLYREWRNYSEGRDVDKLSAGLAGIGLAMTLGELGGSVAGVFTGGTSAAGSIALFEPVRKMCLGIKKTLKFMNPKLKKACQTLFEPVFKQIDKTHLFQNMPGLHNFGEVKAYAKKNINEIGDIAKMANGKLAQLGEIATLYRKNPYAAKLVTENANSIKSVSHLSKLALELGDGGRNIFRFGGKNALDAMEALGKRGQLSADTLKQSMRVGSDGLKAVAKGCWHGLSRILDLIHKFAPLLWWFMFQWFLSGIPMWLALLLEVLGVAVLLKTWSGRWLRPQPQCA